MLTPNYMWVVMCSLWAPLVMPQFTPPIRISSGLLRGVISATGDQRRFMSIPYARVEERFQDSKPVQPWPGVFEALDEHIRCTQRFGKTVIGQEDCLVANVYTPNPAPSNLLPVMVFIHGGGFQFGSDSPLIYGPEYLVRHDVILVTFNYRVDVLGYLCLRIKEAPGNVGIKDQVAALRWVRDNIEAFGGNPDDVTLFGESAGSAAVGYHLVSPMSKGLFHKAIMESGSPISFWAMQFEPLETASKQAYQIGVSTEDPNEIYTAFKDYNAYDLLKARVPRKKGDVTLSENIFVPCVETVLPGVENFLTDTPYNLMSSGQYTKVPMIIGYNSAEGLTFAGNENDTTISQLDFFQALPRDLTFPTEANQRRVADILQRYYMGNKAITRETLADFSRFEGDSGIIFPAIFTTDLILKTTDAVVYSYKFKYNGSLNLAKLESGFILVPGAAHADEIFYLFNVEVPLIMAALENSFIDTMTTMWTNFAKYGDPTPTPIMSTRWQPTERENPQVFEIDRNFSTSPLWQDEIIRFWNETYATYRKNNIL